MCDRSCGLTEQQYQERTQRLAELLSLPSLKNINKNGQ
jgi:hypothetical protein